MNLKGPSVETDGPVLSAAVLRAVNKISLVDSGRQRSVGADSPNCYRKIFDLAYDRSFGKNVFKI